MELLFRFIPRICCREPPQTGKTSSLVCSAPTCLMWSWLVATVRLRKGRVRADNWWGGRWRCPRRGRGIARSPLFWRGAGWDRRKFCPGTKITTPCESQTKCWADTHEYMNNTIINQTAPPQPWKILRQRNASMSKIIINMMELSFFMQMSAGSFYLHTFSHSELSIYLYDLEFFS